MVVELKEITRYSKDIADYDNDQFNSYSKTLKDFLFNSFL